MSGNLLIRASGGARRLLRARPDTRCCAGAPAPFHGGWPAEQDASPPAPGDRCKPRHLVLILEYASKGSGGLADALTLGREVERQFSLKVSYVAIGGQTGEQVWENVRWTNPGVRREQVLDGLDFVPEFLCATAWPTAYWILGKPSRRKLYFVQDYEPWFYRAGVNQYYAARSYELGLEMFTLGPWLARHIEARHGVRGIHGMPFPCTDDPDPGPPLSSRKTVAFYVQPNKEHRGAHLLIEAARRLSRTGIGLEIEIFGSEENRHLDLDFPCRVHGVLAESDLKDFISRTRIGVCASFTNVSLLTFRFLAAGCLAVDLDFDSVKTNIPPAVLPVIRLCGPHPDEMVETLRRLLSAGVSEVERAAVIQCLGQYSWSACVASLESFFRKPSA